MSAGRLVILAGGISSRMRNAAVYSTHTDPKLLDDAARKAKAMIGLGEGDRPFMDYLLFNARETGYEEIVIVVGAADQSIRGYYGALDRDNVFRGLKISYAIQEIPANRSKPLGTADALLQALRSRSDWSGQTFSVCNSDNLYSRRALKQMAASRHRNAFADYDRSALQFESSRIAGFAVTKKDEESYLVDIIEKPGLDQIQEVADRNGRIGVSMNLYRLYYDMILPYLENAPMHPVRQEKELPAAVAAMARDFPKSVYAYPLHEHVPDLTSRGDIDVVKEYLRKEFTDFSF